LQNISNSRCFDAGILADLKPFSLHEDILMRFPRDQRQHQRKANNKCLEKGHIIIADITAKIFEFLFG